MSKPTNVSVEIGGKIRSSEHLIKVFIKKCKKEKIVQEYREKLVFETKARKKDAKKRKAREGPLDLKTTNLRIDSINVENKCRDETYLINDRRIHR